MITGPLIVCSDVSVKYLIRYHVVDTFKESFVHAGRCLLDRILHGKKAQRNYAREFYALKNVTFEVYPGDIIGLIGSNGAGKSTLLRQLAGIEVPDAGMIEVKGAVGSLLSLSAGFMVDLSGIENIFLRGAILGLRKGEIERMLKGIIEFCELGEFIYAPIRTYSSGMAARLGFALAICINPDIILVDEVISVGDERFRRKAGDLFENLGRDRTYLFATHALDDVLEQCTKVLWLHEGQMMYFGEVKEGVDRYYEFMTGEKRNINTREKE